MVEMIQAKDKEKILKGARENDPSLTRGKWLITPIKWKTDCFNRCSRGQKAVCYHTQNAQRKKSVDQKSYIYKTMLSFKNKGKITTFLDKWKPKEFSGSRPTL